MGCTRACVYNLFSAIRDIRASITRVASRSPSHTTVREFSGLRSRTLTSARCLPLPHTQVSKAPPSTDRCSFLLSLQYAINTRQSVCEQFTPASYSTINRGGTLHLNSKLSDQQCRNAMKGKPSTPAEIVAQLPAGFDRARESGDLLFFPSTVHKHEEFGVEVRGSGCLSS